MESETLTEQDLANLGSGAMCDPAEDDLIIEQCLILMAGLGEERVAVGSAFVLGSHTWMEGSDPVTTVIAITAKHCLTNLQQHFETKRKTDLWLGNESNVEAAAVPWNLIATKYVNGEQAYWYAIWSAFYVDDLCLLYLRPGTDLANSTTFRKPLLCFGLPNIGDSLWGMGFGDQRKIDDPIFDFETNIKLTRGNVIQQFVGTSREERLLVALPLKDGMSGGPVFWAKMLIGVISSTMLDGGIGGTASFITRSRHIANFPIDSAPSIDGQTYGKLWDLAKIGIINALTAEGPQHELVVVKAHDLRLYFAKESPANSEHSKEAGPV